MPESRRQLSRNSGRSDPSEVLVSLVQLLTNGEGQAQILCPYGSQLIIVGSTRPKEIGEAVLIDESVSGDVFKQQKPRIIADVTKVRNYKNFLGADMRSEIAVPLPGESGVINVESAKENAFADEHIRILSEYAQRVIVPEARTFVELDTLLRIDEEIGQRITAMTSGDIHQRIYTLICQEAKALVEADHIQLLFSEGDNEHLTIAFSSSPIEDKDKKVRIDSSISGQAVLDRENKNIGDVSKEPKYKETIKEMRSQLAVIAREGQTITAVISVESSRKNAFTARDATLLTLFAQQAGRALRHVHFATTLQRMQSEKQANDTLLAAADVMGNVIHDLSGDIGLIRVQLDCIRGNLKDPNPEVLESVEQIARNVDRVATLPERFKERVAEAQRVITLDLNEIVRKTVQRIRDRDLIPRGIDFDIELNGRPLVSASAYGIEKVTENLVRNAIEATKNGNKITITTRTWPKGKQLAEPSAELEVKDSGIGMDEQTRGLIFEPGFSRKEKRLGGMGFGLFWVKIFLARFRGEIHVQSRPGYGTTFRVWLPLSIWEATNP